MPTLARALDDIANAFEGGTTNPVKLSLLQRWANYYSTHFNMGATNFYVQETWTVLKDLEASSKDIFPQLHSLINTALTTARDDPGMSAFIPPKEQAGKASTYTHDKASLWKADGMRASGSGSHTTASSNSNEENQGLAGVTLVQNYF